MCALKLLVITVFIIFAGMEITLAQELPTDVQRTLESSVVRVVATSGGQALPSRIASGFVWPDSRHVVTAFHVVAGARDILIERRSQGESRIARVVATLRNRDLALLEFDDALTGSMSLPIAPVEEVHSGLDVWVVGYPAGTQGLRSTRLHISEIAPGGLESALDATGYRELTRLGFPDINMDVVQLEGDLVPGHSGAPIVDRNGRVVAVGSGGLQHGTVGLGWAIPAHYLDGLAGAPVDRSVIDQDTLGQIGAIFFETDETPDDVTSSPPIEFSNGSRVRELVPISRWPSISNQYGSVGPLNSWEYALEASSNAWTGAGPQPVSELTGDFIVEVGIRVEFGDSSALGFHLSGAGDGYSQLWFVLHMRESGSSDYAIYEQWIEGGYGYDIARFAESIEVPSSFPNAAWREENILTIRRQGNDVSWYLNGHLLEAFQPSLFDVEQISIGIAGESRFIVTHIVTKVPA